MSLVLLLTVPSAALADDPAPPPCKIPLSSLNVSGSNTPTGSDSSTYTWNCDTGLWENQYYSWDPVTKVKTPKYSQAYVYNSTNGKWESTTWSYDPASSQWIPIVTALSYDPYAPQSSISNTGPTSNNTIDNNSSNPSNNTTINTNTNSQIDNGLTQNATSGNIMVNGNTTGGNGTSGSAMDVANIINLLQSSWGMQPAPNVKTFTANIQGDVNGNLMINPGALSSQVATCGTCAPNTNLTVNAQNSGTINNNLNLAATSGNATVSQNTKAGSATTGTAAAIANVVNLLNSMISAGQSFIGVVNINGNMNGNIYVPSNLVNQLLANNVPSTTLNVGNSTLNANLSNTQAINNSLNSSATSGTASVNQNTNAGNATTGNATTTVRVFNLTGRQIVDANTLLVFINVSGQWVGFMMDASQMGVTAAALGGGVSQNCLCGGNNNTNINAQNNGTINNNLNLAARSGDATVSQNTLAGNATSGSAATAANLLNINNSGLSSSGWFGILFINILGNWHGNFCVNTSTPGCAKTSGGMGGGSNGPKVFRFEPRSSSISNTGPGSGNFIINKSPIGGSSSIDNTGPGSQNVIFNSGTSGSGAGPSVGSGSSKWIVPVVTTLVGISMFGTEQLMDGEKRQKFGRSLKSGVGQLAHDLRSLLF